MGPQLALKNTLKCKNTKSRHPQIQGCPVQWESIHQLEENHPKNSHRALGIQIEFCIQYAIADFDFWPLIIFTFFALIIIPGSIYK